jgi:ribonucleotide reductase beta subunit family protein with ferritin-like domain
MEQLRLPAVNDDGESIINREYLRESEHKIERFGLCVRVYMELKKNILYSKMVEIIGSAFFFESMHFHFSFFVSY